MKKSFFIGLCALMAAIMIGCNKNPQNVETPDNKPATQAEAACTVYVGDCGDKADWTKPMGMPARVSDDELDPYTTPESLEADCMGENQLRIIWMKKDQCAPKFAIQATLNERMITLSCQDTAYMMADCICLFPLYFDFDSLAYGTYSVIAGGVTHEIDFQRDMQPYRYEYKIFHPSEGITFLYKGFFS